MNNWLRESRNFLQLFIKKHGWLLNLHDKFKIKTKMQINHGRII